MKYFFYSVVAICITAIIIAIVVFGSKEIQVGIIACAFFMFVIKKVFEFLSELF